MVQSPAPARAHERDGKCRAGAESGAGRAFRQPLVYVLDYSVWGTGG